ncbi:MAG: hypothetical protein A2V77_23510 [Anaeromyxobacter sp. RBG_16_69_14]|nr:MAG: hypothetical protein A2V77_23510 [Anaeromyxobacter sp. RBG_16_69_14]
MRRRKAPDISSQRRRCRWRITSTGRRCEIDDGAQLVNAAHSHGDLLVATMRDQLQNTMRAFEMTLFALKSGGPAPINLDMTRLRETPPASTPEISKQLELVVTTWGPFKKSMSDLIRSNGSDVQIESRIAQGQQFV